MELTDKLPPRRTRTPTRNWTEYFNQVKEGTCGIERNIGLSTIRSALKRSVERGELDDVFKVATRKQDNGKTYVYICKAVGEAVKK